MKICFLLSAISLVLNLQGWGTTDEPQSGPERGEIHYFAGIFPQLETEGMLHANQSHIFPEQTLEIASHLHQMAQIGAKACSAVVGEATDPMGVVYMDQVHSHATMDSLEQTRGCGAGKNNENNKIMTAGNEFSSLEAPVMPHFSPQGEHIREEGIAAFSWCKQASREIICGNETFRKHLVQAGMISGHERGWEDPQHLEEWIRGNGGLARHGYVDEDLMHALQDTRLIMLEYANAHIGVLWEKWVFWGTIKFRSPSFAETVMTLFCLQKTRDELIFCAQRRVARWHSDTSELQGDMLDSVHTETPYLDFPHALHSGHLAGRMMQGTVSEENAQMEEGFVHEKVDNLSLHAQQNAQASVLEGLLQGSVLAESSKLVAQAEAEKTQVENTYLPHAHHVHQLVTCMVQGKINVHTDPPQAQPPTFMAGGLMQGMVNKVALSDVTEPTEEKQTGRGGGREGDGWDYGIPEEGESDTAGSSVILVWELMQKEKMKVQSNSKSALPLDCTTVLCAKIRRGKRPWRGLSPGQKKQATEKIEHGSMSKAEIAAGRINEVSLNLAVIDAKVIILMWLHRAKAGAGHLDPAKEDKASGSEKCQIEQNSSGTMPVGIIKTITLSQIEQVRKQFHGSCWMDMRIRNLSTAPESASPAHQDPCPGGSDSNNLPVTGGNSRPRDGSEEDHTRKKTKHDGGGGN